ncbi:alpha/beta hydrolase family protein [Actinomadura macra]|uniref:alpha/beta hydrolase family protein n=1 Tax=Actinomadura macra TaxID=46164 RepID=UPI001FDF5CC3|nr:lipase [Actinomadura macra]
MTPGPTRRSVLAAGGTAALLLATTGTAAADRYAAGVKPRQRGGRIQLTLPRPTGGHHVGTTSLHLVDRSRQDPWSSTGSPRELMISLWYPTRDAAGRPRAAWLTPAALALYRQQTSRSLQTPLDDVDFPVTHAYRDAPFSGRHPVVLFSPGYGAMRALGTALVEDLASRGYVVVTIDHTYEAEIVEFPGGRLETGRRPAKPTEKDIVAALRVRQDDTRFVLNELARLDAGAGHRRLPRGLPGSLDLSRTGMFGHSLGGDTAAETMAQDARIRAGIDLDGSISGDVAVTGLDRPFMLMASAGHGRDNDPSWEDLWSHLRGWRRELLLRDSGHQAYTDLSPLAQQLVKALPVPPAVVAKLTESIGTIDAGRAVTAQRAYVGAFFDLHLRGRDHHLLSGPSPRFPEIEFVP